MHGDERLTAAVIGAGMISQHHLRYLQRSALARPVAICDRSPAMARFAAERYGVADTFDDHVAMLDALRPQVVHVLTPARTHAAIAKQCLERGAHVIVEKPAAMNANELDELFAVADANGRQLIEDHNYRFNTPLRQLAAIDLGDVRDVDVHLSLPLRDGGRYADADLPHPSHDLPCGVIHEFITHVCYLALSFMPDNGFDTVTAAWRNHGGGALFKYDDLDATVIQGNVHARLRVTCAAPGSLTIAVRGTRGQASTDLYHPHLHVNRDGWTLMRSAARGIFAKIAGRTAYEGLSTLLDRTYRGLRGNNPLPVSREQIMQTTRLIDALLDGSNQR